MPVYLLYSEMMSANGSGVETGMWLDTSINTTYYPSHALFPLNVLKMLPVKKMLLNCRPNEIRHETLHHNENK